MYSHKKETPPPNQAFPALPRPSENQEERKELDESTFSDEFLGYVLPMLEERKSILIMPRSESDPPFQNHEFSKEEKNTHEEILNMLDEYPFLLEE